jgi:hypothetical protein
MYKDLDFLEIGTSDFDTLLQSAPDELIGMSVEPIKKYLDNLPAKANVTKVNAAIKAKNRDETCQVYYITDNVIDDHSLPSFLKGCNSINEYNLQHNLLNIQPEFEDCAQLARQHHQPWQTIHQAEIAVWYNQN